MHSNNNSKSDLNYVKNRTGPKPDSKTQPKPVKVINKTKTRSR